MAWPLALLGGCLIMIALLAVYVPTIYIRKTDKVIGLLEKIEANTRK
jgi:muramoyltetrapeptide carboxypeptidase LdcA involved in peptidoglycan recycling